MTSFSHDGRRTSRNDDLADLFSEEERSWLWPRHCAQMAEATRAMAELCDEAAMMADYLDLAARWERKASGEPELHPEERSRQIQ
jgi:hypothetical protein